MKPFAYACTYQGHTSFTKDAQMGEVGWPALGATVYKLFTDEQVTGYCDKLEDKDARIKELEDALKKILALNYQHAATNSCAYTAWQIANNHLIRLRQHDFVDNGRGSCKVCGDDYLDTRHAIAKARP